MHIWKKGDSRKPLKLTKPKVRKGSLPTAAMQRHPNATPPAPRRQGLQGHTTAEEGEEIDIGDVNDGNDSSRNEDTTNARGIAMDSRDSGEHSMEVSIVDAALPIEYSWDCPYIQQIFHGKLLVETVSYRFQDTVNIQRYTGIKFRNLLISKFDHCIL